jgi:NAD(P)H-dependent FMN reductase
MEAVTFDLKDADFPIFDERLSYLDDPSQSILDYADKVKNADAFIFISPEYNGGYPAAFKNAFDLLYTEWKHKPAGIVSVSAGSFGGSQVTVQIQSVISKVGMVPISAVFPIPKVQEAFDEEGNPSDDRTASRAEKFLDTLADYSKRFRD